MQINTTFSRRNVEDFDNIATLMERKNIVLWSVFFLVPTGRGKIADLLSAEEFETVFAKLYKLSRRALFHIKTTERNIPALCAATAGSRAARRRRAKRRHPV